MSGTPVLALIQWYLLVLLIAVAAFGTNYLTFDADSASSLGASATNTERVTANTWFDDKRATASDSWDDFVAWRSTVQVEVKTTPR